MRELVPMVRYQDDQFDYIKINEESKICKLRMRISTCWTERMIKSRSLINLLDVPFLLEERLETKVSDFKSPIFKKMLLKMHQNDLTRFYVL